MRKQLRIISRLQIAIDRYSKEHYTVPAKLPTWLFCKHIRRRSKYTWDDGTEVIDIDSDWCIHCPRNGSRMLSILPF